MSGNDNRPAKRKSPPGDLKLSEATIDCSSLFQAEDLAAGVGETLDMSTLSQKLCGNYKEAFLPSTRVYVRQEMIYVFKQLTAERSQDEDVISQVLIGSPGVGKSILCFLVAIWQAMRGNQVVYWRKTSQQNEHISVFVLDRLNEDTTKVRFKFNREIKSGYLRYLHETWLCPLLGREPEYDQLEKGLCVIVDGPNHTDTKDTFDGKVHYLCTSGGHPMPRNEAEYSMEIVALGGWEKKPLESCLEVVLPSPLNDEQFDYVYHLAGGRVRDAMRVSASKKKRQRFMKLAKQKVGTDSVQAAVLAAQSTEGSADENSRDSFRTMFVDDEGIVYQMVDSAFKLALLIDRCNMDELLKAYKMTLQFKMKSAAGCLFEELMHKWFVDKKPPPCTLTTVAVAQERTD